MKDLMNKRFLWTLSAGHGFTDLNQGALPAILPFLITAGNLSYAAAAGLTFAMSLSSSVMQPLFGYLADKVSKPWLMPASILLAGLSLASIGFLPDYRLMFAAAVISGIGVAAFHPEGARLANRASGKRKGAGISIFSVGGNLGFALGPAITTPAMIFLGLKGSLVLAIPAVIMFFALLSQIKRIAPHVSAANAGGVFQPEPKKDEWGKFSWLTLAIIARSVIFYSLITFLPLYWLNVLHQSKAASGAALTVMFAAGAVFTLLGGALTDRFGARAVVRLGILLLIPSVYLLTVAESAALATVLLIPTAFGLFAVAGPLVLLGQGYLPNKIGLASGVTLGLAVSIGGLAAPFMGKYADKHGLLAAMGLLVFIPVFAAFIVLTLKKPAV